MPPRRRLADALAPLAAVASSTALPYGYTLAIWSSGAILQRNRGAPTVGQVFLFLAGAIAAFATIAALTARRRARASDPEQLRIAGGLQLLAVGAAVGAVTLVALIPGGIAWPLGGFSATLVYLVAAAVEISLTARLSRRSFESPD